MSLRQTTVLEEQSGAAQDIPINYWERLEVYLLSRWGNLTSNDIESIQGRRQSFNRLMQQHYRMTTTEADGFFSELVTKATEG